MSRVTIDNLLTSVRSELKTRFNVDATIRYSRVGDQTELDASPDYYLEPGAFRAIRSNVGSARVVQEVRLLSEEAAVYEDLPERIAATIAKFEQISRDLLKTPNFVQGAFLENVSTFADAPTCYSVEQAEGYSNVFGGIALSFGIE